MSQDTAPPRGTRDLVGPEAARHAVVEAAARRLFEAYGYEEVRTPLFEAADLFARSVGGETEIVSKEMYVFEDKKGRRLALRPEGTAGVVRAFVESGLPSARWWYAGPMFRHERPQKGRQRQFHQVGVEAIGFESSEADVEAIDLAVSLLGRLGIAGARVRLSSLGCAACRPAFRAALVPFLEARRGRLCPDCHVRLERNPLRVLDCKVPTCREALDGAPSPLDHLCEACRAHRAGVEAGLADLGIAFDVDPRIVRGLDYYTRTVFEVSSDLLGAQDALLGGGRYDGLVEALGGKPTPAVGWAAGIERLALAMPEGATKPSNRVIYVAWTGEEGCRAARSVAKRLRALYADRLVPVRVELALEGSLKGQLRAASRREAVAALVMGEAEARAGTATLRRLNDSSQETLPLDRLEGALAAILD